ncbi:MAG: 2-hydroxychromene-2-carboxylate isomerase [Parvibaculaceae bacterium]|nr:2-hydroxychromene-2-carboxylate isomerase [Parvibaculaceae bacterium]
MDLIMTQVDFIFDFASPNAYFCHKVLPQIAARTGARFNYVPTLLGGLFKLTGNQAPMIAFGGIPNKMAYEQLETVRFLNDHKLTDFKLNASFPINTLLIMRGLIAAENAGVKDTYIDVVLKGMWEDDQKMDDPAVVLSVLNAGGLDGEALLAATQDPDVKAKLIDNTQAAADRGAFGIPSFYVGEELFFGKDRLAQVEAAILATR